MICHCFGRSLDLGAVARRARETASLMVGVPDYETYAAHMRARHPDQEPMPRDTFFRERQDARYGFSKGRFRCC